MRKLLLISLVAAAPMLLGSTGTSASAWGWGCGCAAPSYGYSSYGYSAPRVYGYSSYYRPGVRFYGARTYGWRGGVGVRRVGWGGQAPLVGMRAAQGGPPQGGVRPRSHPRWPISANKNAASAAHPEPL